MKATLSVLCVCLFACGLVYAQTDPVQPDPAAAPMLAADTPALPKRNLLKELVSPNVLLFIPGAAYSQWHNFPKDWGQGTRSFEKRLASQYGQYLTGELMEFGVLAIHDEDTRYIRQGQGKFFSRMGHVIITTVVARRSDGGKTFAYSTAASSYGGWALATLWNPHSEQTAGSIFGWGSENMGLVTAGHFVKEFWPDVKSVLHKKK